jgi:hypothetical protein
MHARVDFARARSNMNQITDLARQDLESSDTYRQASDALDSARQAYVAARERIMESVQQDPDYQAAVAERDAYSQMIVQMRAQERPDEVAVMDLSARKLDAGATANRIVARALAADDDAQRAHRDLMAASSRVTALRDGAERSLHSSPDWRAAREAVWDARSRAFTTDAYLAGTIDARDRALRLANRQITANAGALYDHLYSPYYPLFSRHRSYGGCSGGFAVGYPVGW